MFRVIHDYFQMYLKTFKINVWKYMNLILLIFLSAAGLAWQACLIKTKAKLELLTDIDMLLMIENRIGGGICHAIHRYVIAKNKYMENYDKDKESSYLMCLDANNLYGWTMSQKLPVNGFEWVENIYYECNLEYYEKLVKKYDENSDKGYILEVHVEYPKRL